MVTTYTLDPAASLTMTLAGTTNEVTTKYWQGMDTLAQNDGTNTRLFAYDGLGSLRQMTDGATLTFNQTFDPYGNPYAKAGSATTALGYTGEATDANGFVYLRARYYNPSMGRFMQFDPSRAEVNLYGYADGNPITNADPTGQCYDLAPFFSPQNILVPWLAVNTSVNAFKECAQNLSNAWQIATNPGISPAHKEGLLAVNISPIGVSYRHQLVTTQEDFAAGAIVNDLVFGRRAFNWETGQATTRVLGVGLNWGTTFAGLATLGGARAHSGRAPQVFESWSIESQSAALAPEEVIVQTQRGVNIVEGLQNLERLPNGFIEIKPIQATIKGITWNGRYISRGGPSGQIRKVLGKGGIVEEKGEKGCSRSARKTG